MKNSLRILVTACLLLLTLMTGVRAGEMEMPAITSSPELNRIKGLAGRWVTESDMFGKKERLYVDYEVTAHGNAVLERIFPGTPHEMISVYYDDKGKLTMTHVCYGREKGKEKPEAMTMEYTRVEVKKSRQKGSSS